jgi:PBSX family phage terminase large subunit
MLKTSTIPWAAFSQKHKDYISRAFNNRMCVAEGAIRSGKTIDHCIIAADYLETCPDRIHLASGSYIPNAKLNIGVCNGFGLEFLFRGRCRWGKFRSNEALYLYTQTGDKIVIFAGGGKADSYKKILGNSYGLWIATEINEHYDCPDSRESFIKVAFGRQAAAKAPFILWDLNPCSPGHTIYRDYIDKYKQGFIGGYLYQHFTIGDNLSITPERRAEIESQYEPGSLWYRRDILGERLKAQGLIYQNFSEALHVVPPTARDYERYQISADYGTYNAFHAILWGLCAGVWYAVKEYRFSGREEGVQKDPTQYYTAVKAVFGPLQIQRWIIDPSADAFIAYLRNKREAVLLADNAVAAGIERTAAALNNGLIKICDCCKGLITEFGAYGWNEKKEDDEPLKVNDHGMDALRYFVNTNRLGQKSREYFRQ